MKTCTKCHKRKKLDKFHFVNKETGRRQSRCKKCVNLLDHQRYIKNRDEIKVQRKEYRRNFPHIIKNCKLKYYHGITIKQFNALLKKQNGKCAICRMKEYSSNKENGTVKSLAVDHCHKTGRIRGLLCGQCNRDLGTYEKCKINSAFINYLEKYSATR